MLNHLDSVIDFIFVKEKPMFNFRYVLKSWFASVAYDSRNESWIAEKTNVVSPLFIYRVQYRQAAIAPTGNCIFKKEKQTSNVHVWMFVEQIFQTDSKKVPTWQEQVYSNIFWNHHQYHQPLEHYQYPIGSMGLVYLPTWIFDFYGRLVGKYTSPTDPMGYIYIYIYTKVLCKLSSPPEVEDDVENLMQSSSDPQGEGDTVKLAKKLREIFIPKWWFAQPLCCFFDGISQTFMVKPLECRCYVIIYRSKVQPCTWQVTSHSKLAPLHSVLGVGWFTSHFSMSLRSNLYSIKRVPDATSIRIQMVVTDLCLKDGSWFHGCQEEVEEVEKVLLAIGIVLGPTTLNNHSWFITKCECGQENYRPWQVVVKHRRACNII